MFGDALAGLLWGGFLRLVIIHHTTFFVNSLAHWVGQPSYNAEISARDNWAVALLTLGEGYHSFHHRFPDLPFLLLAITPILIIGWLSQRQLVRGLFLGFSVGGAIFALSNLITSTIAASQWFQTAKGAVEDWFRAIVLGETPASAAIRRAKPTLILPKRSMSQRPASW